MRVLGRYQYVTFTKILKALHERAYFHLIYGTRNPKGIEEFRGVEKRLTTAQAQVRADAQREHRQKRTGQTELQFGDPGTLSRTVEDERREQREKARSLLFELLAKRRRRYEDLVPILLQLPLFWKTDLHDLLREEHKAGRIKIEGMKPRQRIPKEGCVIGIVT